MGSSKKINALQQERQAELKKKFFKTLGDLCTQLFGENVLLLLPAHIKEKIYLTRFRDFKFDFHTNQLLNEHLTVNVQKIIHRYYYDYIYPYGPTECKLTLAQSDIYLFQFSSLVNALTPQSFANAALFIEKTKSLQQIVLPPQEHINHTHSKFIMACSHLHLISDFYVRGNLLYDQLPPVNDFTPVRTRFTFDFIKAPSRKFNIGGRTRPAFQLLNILHPVTLPPITVTPAQLGMNTPFNNIPLEVYMQQHAVDRLFERLDVLPLFMINIALVNSLIKPETCFDSHGNRLVVIRNHKAKLGYLRVDLVEGCILIRTFLLFTQDSTPEGEKIKQFAGFEKEDITYLKLDKISSFINLDFTDNSRLVKLLKQSGLGDFVEFQSVIKGCVGRNCRQDIASSVEKYINPCKPENGEGDLAHVTLQQATCPADEPM